MCVGQDSRFGVSGEADCGLSGFSRVKDVEMATPAAETENLTTESTNEIDIVGFQVSQD